MLMTKRKPATVGEIMVEEFMRPRVDPGRSGRGDGRAAQACERAVQRPSERNGGDGPHPRPHIRQQPRLLAERATAQRPVGGDAQPQGPGADRTRPSAQTRVSLPPRRPAPQQPPRAFVMIPRHPVRAIRAGAPSRFVIGRPSWPGLVRSSPGFPQSRSARSRRERPSYRPSASSSRGCFSFDPSPFGPPPRSSQ